MKSISPNTFEERVGDARHANSIIFHNEIAWYANDSYTLFGTLIQDKIDKDFSVVILGRDKSGKYGAVKQEVNFHSKKEAEEWLNNNLL